MGVAKIPRRMPSSRRDNDESDATTMKTFGGLAARDPACAPCVAPAPVSGLSSASLPVRCRPRGQERWPPG